MFKLKRLQMTTATWTPRFLKVHKMTAQVFSMKLSVLLKCSHTLRTMTSSRLIPSCLYSSPDLTSVTQHEERGPPCFATTEVTTKKKKKKMESSKFSPSVIHDTYQICIPGLPPESCVCKIAKEMS